MYFLFSLGGAGPLARRNYIRGGPSGPALPLEFSARSNQPHLACSKCGLSAIERAEFAEHVRHVIFHRAFRDA